MGLCPKPPKTVGLCPTPCQGARPLEPIWQTHIHAFAGAKLKKDKNRLRVGICHFPSQAVFCRNILFLPSAGAYAPAQTGCRGRVPCRGSGAAPHGLFHLSQNSHTPAAITGRRKNIPSFALRRSSLRTRRRNSSLSSSVTYMPPNSPVCVCKRRFFSFRSM